MSIYVGAILTRTLSFQPWLILPKKVFFLSEIKFCLIIDWDLIDHLTAWWIQWWLWESRTHVATITKMISRDPLDFEFMHVTGDWPQVDTRADYCTWKKSIEYQLLDSWSLGQLIAEKTKEIFPKINQYNQTWAIIDSTLHYRTWFFWWNNAYCSEAVYKVLEEAWVELDPSHFSPAELMHYCKPVYAGSQWKKTFTPIPADFWPKSQVVT